MKKQSFNLEEIIRVILGNCGKMVSSSKSCGPPMAVYNANVVIDDKIIWYGDVDIEVSGDELCRLSNLSDKTIEVYYEHPVRQFNFDEMPKKEFEKQQKKIIQETTPVWTTAEPDKYAGYEWDDIYVKHEKSRDEIIKSRQIAFGSLTPNGSEWTWYNTWYYKSIHKMYRIMKYFCKQFVHYPLESLKYKKQDDSNIKPIKYFLKTMIREMGYHRVYLEEQIEKKGHRKALVDYFFDH